MPPTKPKPIPDRYRRVTPALMVNGAARAIEFYAEVFGATGRMRFPGPDGDRDGFIIDPFGHAWTIGSHVEDVAVVAQLAAGGTPPRWPAHAWEFPTDCVTA